MTEKIQRECGPKATEIYYPDTSNWNNYYKCYNYNAYTHEISGTGSVDSTGAKDDTKYNTPIVINEGITELKDGCFNKQSISSITLPETLTKIGNNCFTNSKITSIKLPAALEEIGDSNFPASISTVQIPPLVSNFPISNFKELPNLVSITVHEDSKYYKSINGVLYNYDLSEIIYCPNGKSGVINIPNSVKRIGDACFYKCKELTAIHLPSSIESIGDCSFMGISLDMLILPNSITSIGSDCFNNTTIKKKFSFPKQITTIPNSAFYKASIPNDRFLQNVVCIEDYAFKDSMLSSNHIFLEKVRNIGTEAFNGVRGVETIELYSSLEKIGSKAFSFFQGNLRVNSIAPLRLDYDVFENESHISLFVPMGAAIIYKNAYPWQSLDEIFEIGIDKEIKSSDEDEETDCETSVKLDTQICRLRSIANSYTTADRFFLREIIQNASYNYQDVSCDEEFEDAMLLLKYNSHFTPVIWPQLNNTICENWDMKNKVKVSSYHITEYGESLLSADNSNAGKNDIHQSLIDNGLQTDILNFPELTVNQNSDIESYFDNIQKIIQNELSMANHSIKIAVSWFTNYDLFKQLQELANTINIELIINNDSVNNGGYCLPFNELLEKGVHMSLVEYPHMLHHKFCVIDDTTVITGSYNWTRFSESNYENIIVTHGNNGVASSYIEEFERIWNVAEHKDIEAMPNCVPQRPEYDRNAFKQYITEELNAEARKTNNERDKITQLHSARKLNKEYFDKINPSAKEKYKDTFTILDKSAKMKEEIIKTIQQQTNNVIADSNPLTSTSSIKNPPQTIADTNKPSSSGISVSVNKSTDGQQCSVKNIIKKIQASSMAMLIDVSASMKNAYQAGHVHAIAKMVLSASLQITNEKELNLWSFGSNVYNNGTIGIENIQDLTKVVCKNEGTELIKAVNEIKTTLKDKSLVIIFTDDDASSINDAISAMENKRDIFWQIIVYEKKFTNIQNAVKSKSNIDVVCLENYSNMKDDELNKAILSSYLVWRSKSAS